MSEVQLAHESMVKTTQNQLALSPQLKDLAPRAFQTTTIAFPSSPISQFQLAVDPELPAQEGELQ